MRGHFPGFLRHFLSAPRLFLVLAGIFLVTLSSTGRTQEQLRIAAVVNDDLVSEWDLQQRVAFIMVSTGQPQTQENAQRLVPIALRQLIDEKLEAKEAKERGVDVSQQEVDAAVTDIEQSNHLPPGGLTQILGQVNLPITVLSNQLRTRIAWQRTVARKVHALNDVTDEEVDEALAEFAATNDKPQSLVSEIVLNIDNPESEPQVRANADRLVQQIRAGTQLGTLARQFSDSSAAASEGDLGWVREGQLDPKIEAVVQGLKPGEVSAPIRLLNGYHIVQLRDRRSAREIASLSTETVQLAHASLPTTPTTSAAEIAAMLDKLRQATSEAKSCADLTDVASKIGGASGNLGSMQSTQLPPAVQALIAHLPINQPSPPTFLEDHVAVLMVCNRTGSQASTTLPTRDEIRERLFLQRVDAATRRYIRDLRLAAYIDVRQ
jgi:peptidyl-prolyl cis-trans isomerase SurA